MQNERGPRARGIFLVPGRALATARCLQFGRETKIPRVKRTVLEFAPQYTTRILGHKRRPVVCTATVHARMGTKGSDA